MSEDIAILGAGKIGRGVVGLLFSRAGYRLHLYDVFMDGMLRLRSQGYYTVHVTDGNAVDEIYRVDGFDIVDSTSADASVELLSRISLAACCVYEGAFESVSQVIADAIRRRIANGNDACLNILLCVNALGAPARVTGYIEAGLSADERDFFRSHVGVCQVMVLAAGMPTPPGSSDEWEVTVSADPRLEIDGDAWRGERIAIPRVTYVGNAEGMIYRKVYCGNMRHTMAGFMGEAQGLTTMDAAQQDPWIRANITSAFNEAHDAILHEYRFDAAEDGEWVSWLDAKLDAKVKDPIERVISNPEEKLGYTNRFVGPARLCLEHHIVPYYLARGIAYGLRHVARARGEEPADARAIGRLAREICGFKDDDWEVEGLVVKHYQNMLQDELRKS